MGPYGAIQCDGSEYHGRYAENMTEQELMEFHKPRIDCLVEASCDLLAIETIPCYKEAASIMNLLKTYYPDVKAWLTFSCKVCHKQKSSILKFILNFILRIQSIFLMVKPLKAFTIHLKITLN